MTTYCQTVAIHPQASLPLDNMWGLFARHYAGVKREIFERDLYGKKQALLLWRKRELIGFTSQRFEQIDGYRVTFSGDVIIIPEARDIGTAHFFHQWARAVWKECDWWCALSAGQRTFRIAPTFYHRVTPNAGTEETEQERTLRHRFAEFAYGSAYKPALGIVQLEHPYTLAQPEQNIREAYPMDAYFQRANPGWAQGDELVSLVSLHPDNWKPVALRMLRWKVPNNG